MAPPKVLLWDIETSYMLVETHTLYPNFISHKQIVLDWFIICAAWRWEGQKKVNAVSVLDDPKRFKEDHRDDFHVVKTLHDTLTQADMVIGHNGDAFDLKKFMARVLFHRLPPVPKIVQEDTLKIARKEFKITSNRLDYLGEYLGVGKKIVTPEGLWRGASNGVESDIKTMVRYNKGDITLLDDVWQIIKPYSKAKLNMNHFQPGDCCPRCKSKNYKKNGWRYSPSCKYQKYQCKDCGHPFTGERIKHKTVVFK